MHPKPPAARASVAAVTALGPAQWGCILSGGAATSGARSRAGDRPTRSGSHGGGCLATSRCAAPHLFSSMREAELGAAGLGGKVSVRGVGGARWAGACVVVVHDKAVYPAAQNREGSAVEWPFVESKKPVPAVGEMRSVAPPLMRESLAQLQAPLSAPVLSYRDTSPLPPSPSHHGSIGTLGRGLGRTAPLVFRLTLLGVSGCGPGHTAPLGFLL